VLLTEKPSKTKGRKITEENSSFRINRVNLKIIYVLPVPGRLTSNLSIPQS